MKEEIRRDTSGKSSVIYKHTTTCHCQNMSFRNGIPLRESIHFGVSNFLTNVAWLYLLPSRYFQNENFKL